MRNIGAKSRTMNCDLEAYFRKRKERKETRKYIGTLREHSLCRDSLSFSREVKPAMALPPTEKFWLSSADVDLSSVLDVLDEVAIIIGLDTVIIGTLHFVNASVRYI